ncbi:rCG62718 [Rattus norvegicus]|uniref:RCG62718 n=1 Tax=Rattus norvegicus TaxID=10116 RepID=A6J5Y0_RAT|nr:rCG62718 [Rattus norvegicus]
MCYLLFFAGRSEVTVIIRTPVLVSPVECASHPKTQWLKMRAVPFAHDSAVRAESNCVALLPALPTHHSTAMGQAQLKVGLTGPLPTRL